MATLGRERLFMFHSRNSVQIVTVLVLLLSLVTNSAFCQSSHTDLLFNIIEEQSVGTYIGNITENQYLYKNLTSSQRKQLEYRLLYQSRYPASLFRVDESSGGIYVASRIDRESRECYRQPTCILEFKVVLSSSKISFSNIATVLVTVADKNDNPPYFPAQESGSVVLDIFESAAVGKQLKLSGAEDRDSDHNNTVQHYALTAYNNVFSVKSSTKLDGTSLLDLTLLQPLDREVISSYRFSILAFDGGSPPLSAALLVQIHVSDENDNAPQFINGMHNIEIRNEVKMGQMILKVSASDLDSDEYGMIHYQLSSIQHQQLGKKFHVNEVTGEISVVSELAPGDHQFIVEAFDGGNPPLTSQIVVRVKVLSSRNNPPSLQINSLSNGSNSFVEVPEDATLGAFVAFFTVEDHDEGDRGDIMCYLDNDVLRLEAVAGRDYKLTLNRALDRETRDSYNVTVTCSDNGQPPLSTSRSFLVIVTDVNDNLPKFKWDTFSKIVPEGNYSNRHVIQVTATDPDIGKNAELIYSIDSSAHLPFRMDRVSGIISATGQLDRETTPVYTFKVYAADRGHSLKTTSANVIITLEDVNDQYPTFIKSIFEFRTPENTPDRTLVGTLSAYDYDEGNNRKFEFFYTGSVVGADPFVVTTEGKILTSAELDREQRDSYSFNVMVRDKGLPPKTTHASVVVTVLDVNDNTPKIQFPVSANHTIHVSTVPHSGMVLTKIVAYDPDAAENGSLQFLVLYGNVGAIDIDSSTGEVKVKDVSKLKNKRVYRLVVGVQDYGLPPQSSNTTILVDINFDNSSGVLLRETEGEAKAEGYFMIVAGVAATTVLLSAIIIVTVCLVFRQDRQYCGKQPAGNNQADIKDDGEFFSSNPAPHGKLCDDERLRPSLEEEGDEKNDEYTAIFNYDVFRMKQMATETLRNSQRKNNLSFASMIPVVEKGAPKAEVGSPISPAYRNVASVRSGEKADTLKYHHQLLPQQVDEVGSDTNGVTDTSDSGRGGSEDDANMYCILHGERDRQGCGQVVTSSQPSVDNERYSRLPPPCTPKGELNKPYYTLFNERPTHSCDSVPTSHSLRSRSTTLLHDSVPTNQSTVSISPSERDSQIMTLFTPRTSRAGSFSSSLYKDVSFTTLSQHSPQRTLSTFSLPARSQTSFSTSQKRRSSSQHSATTGDDDTSTTTSGSFTVNPEELPSDV